MEILPYIRVHNSKIRRAKVCILSKSAIYEVVKKSFLFRINKERSKKFLLKIQFLTRYLISFVHIFHYPFNIENEKK